MKELAKKLSKVQELLNAPKSQRNTFGKYTYRSCEDILQAVKPLLGCCILTISDDLVTVGGRIYVKSTASFSDGESHIAATGLAREAEEQKGMQASQLTGSTSSYARKYALNGLFAIDDNKDIDAENDINTPKFSVDSNAKKWIQVVKANPESINNITSSEYRKFIKLEAAK